MTAAPPDDAAKASSDDSAPAPADGNAPASLHGAGGTSTSGADYFDGRSARARPVQLRCDGPWLLIRGDGVERRVLLREVQWPERTRHGARLAHLPDGSSLQAHDNGAWDAWRRVCGGSDSLVVRAQQTWRAVAASTLGLFAVLAAIFVWGVPWAARQALTLTPPTVDRALGEAALRSIDGELLRPSRLAPDEQRRLRLAFESALARSPAALRPAHMLVFRSSRLGPNAFALPGGTIVLTDELVELVQADADVITGVLAHELGHVRERHGMRLVAQVAALGIVSSVVLGDFSSLLAAAPAWLGQASYSRDAEREADADALQVLHHAGISPQVMVRFFEALAARRARAEGAARAEASSAPRGDAADGGGLGIAIASHPADAERVRFFRDAANMR